MKVDEAIAEVRMMFEFEFCHDCGGDFEDHDLCVVPGLPGLFARCRGGV